MNNNIIFRFSIKSLFTVFLLHAVAGSLLYAQNNLLNYETDFTPSVETFQMSKYGIIEPSYYTGEMNYSIPLYEYKDNDFDLPITLDYHFDGYKVAMASGTVGMGWCINVGGVITREIRGVMDEQRVLTYGPSAIEGYLFAKNPFQSTVQNLELLPIRRTASPYVINYQHDAISGLSFSPFTGYATYDDYQNGLDTGGFGNQVIPKHYDAAADIFHFSFMGYTGDFMMLEDGSFKIFNANVPCDSWSIEIYNVTSYYTQTHQLVAPSIRIVSEDGTEYLFGNQFKNIEFTYSEDRGDNPQAFDLPISAWKLYQITSPNQTDIININYSDYAQKQLANEFLYQNDRVIYSEQVSQISSVMDPIPSLTNSSYFGGTGEKYSEKTSASYSYPIASITRNGIELVSFIYSDKAKQEFAYDCFERPSLNAADSRPQRFPEITYAPEKKLDSIIVMNAAGDTIRRVKFEHSYTSSINASPKMFLSSVSILGEGTYDFEYNRANSSDQFPRIDCRGRDHWGYWNGLNLSPSPENLIPVIDATDQDRNLYNIIRTTRNPSFAHTMYGALTKINYPYGGYSVIEYEQNSSGRRVNRDWDNPSLVFPENNTSNFPTGGVRVWRITSSNSIRSDTTTITYKVPGVADISSGMLMVMPRYVIGAPFSYYEERLENGNIYYINSRGYATGLCNSANYAMLRDPIVGYSYVQVHHPDGSHTDYKYSDYDSNPDAYGTVGSVIYDKMYPLPANVGSGYVDGMERIKGLTIPPFSEQRGSRGKLVQTLYYDAEDNLKKEILNTYDILDVTSGVPMWYNAALGMVRIDYCCRYPVLAMVKESEIENGRVTRFKRYTYDSDGRKITEALTDSTGQNGSKMYYHYTKNNDFYSPYITKVVKTALSMGQEFIIAADSLTYYPDNPHPKSIISTLFKTPVNTSGVSNIFKVGLYNRALTTTFTYNSHFRPVRVDFPGGRYAEYSWDSNGRNIISKRVNSADEQWLYQWKDLIGLTQITEPSGILTSYSYDAEGRLETVRDANGYKIEQYDYNLVNEN